MTTLPETKYAKSGDYHIAYQTIGTGPPDLVFMHGWISHIEHMWEEPRVARFLDRLASFSRLILLDKRGTGMSDPFKEGEVPTVEQHAADIEAILDATKTEKAVVMGLGEGGAAAAFFAATRPERTVALVMIDSFAKLDWNKSIYALLSDKPGQIEAVTSAFYELFERGTGHAIWAPSFSLSGADARDWSRAARYLVSPGTLQTIVRAAIEIDITDVLDQITLPTLIIHRTGDRVVNVSHGRFLAERIPSALYVELPGDDHVVWTADQARIAELVRDFIGGKRP
ncbi:MAG TPA: alpha/beta hydrolase, partial [Methylomirabilota bacterium]|nr:alpha/beta hydrolase [Methylomirabilota bacterium]